MYFLYWADDFKEIDNVEDERLNPKSKMINYFFTVIFPAKTYKYYSQHSDCN